jgi:hypothetical protein
LKSRWDFYHADPLTQSDPDNSSELLEAQKQSDAELDAEEQRKIDDAEEKRRKGAGYRERLIFPFKRRSACGRFEPPFGMEEPLFFWPRYLLHPCPGWAAENEINITTNTLTVEPLAAAHRQGQLRSIWSGGDNLDRLALSAAIEAVE